MGRCNVSAALRALSPLQHTAQFRAVMDAGVVASTPHFVLHVLHWEPVQEESLGRPLIASGTHLGALVPKRHAKRAVTRSTIKRQIRAVCAERVQHIPANTALVVRLRTVFDRQQFISATSPQLKQAVRGELQELLEKARWNKLRVGKMLYQQLPSAAVKASVNSGTMAPAP